MHRLVECVVTTTKIKHQQLSIDLSMTIARDKNNIFNLYLE
jgi:hypothetical protein